MGLEVEMEAKPLETRKKRRLIFRARVNMVAMDKLADELISLNLKSAKPIELVIKSPGGEGSAALMLYDVMKSMRAPVTGIAMGRCDSAALVIYSACQVRIATRHSWFLFHESSLDGSDPRILVDRGLRARMARVVELAESVDAMYKKVLSEEFKLKEGTIASLMEQGERLRAPLSAAEMLKLGIVHKVVPSYPMF
jgi:ATP-dependent protease ClpP protease subunit